MPRRRRPPHAPRPSTAKARPKAAPVRRVSKATREQLSKQRRAYLRTGKTKAERAEERRRPRVSKATREKLSAQRRAFVRTGKTKAERAFESARRTLERQREQVAALRAQAQRRTSAAERSREYWRAVRAIAAQEGVSALEARHRHKDRLAASKRAPAAPSWAPRAETEPTAFALSENHPEIAGAFPHNITIVLTLAVELWHTGPMPGAAGMSFRDLTNRQLVTTAFRSGATFDEFWANFYAAVRQVRDAYAQAMGFVAGYGRGGAGEGIEDSASYTVIGLAAA